MNAQREIKSLFKSAITSLEEFIELAKNPTTYFEDYKEELSNDLPKALGALSALKYNGLIVDYNDSHAIKTLRLIEPDYKTANLLAREAYTIDGENNIHYLHNFVLGYYQYYIDTIKRSGENEEMLEEIKTYLRKYITKMEKVDRNKEQDDDLSEARGLLEFLENKRSSVEPISEEEEDTVGRLWNLDPHLGLDHPLDLDQPLGLDPSSTHGGKSIKHRSIKHRSIKHRSIKHRSIKRKSIKRKSIKCRSIKRKSKTYKKTRRNYRKTKSYYKK
jgi:hypothetical protein